MNLKSHSATQLIGIVNSESEYISDTIKQEATNELKLRKKNECSRLASKKQRQQLWKGVDQNNPFVII